jgi:hypothetical protein
MVVSVEKLNGKAPKEAVKSSLSAKWVNYGNAVHGLYATMMRMTKTIEQV